MVTIVGAGMSGLLAANLLRQNEPRVIEKQRDLPNNHSAVLRFRTNKVADAIGISFRKVTMKKDTLRWMNPIADALAYSYKNGKMRLSDRSIPMGLIEEERFIAPSDLIGRMARGVTIDFGTDWKGPTAPFNPVISTLPMPVLMKLLDYPNAQQSFRSVPGVNVKATIGACNAYVSMYVPNPDFAFTRVSITGSELIVEVPYVNEQFPIENLNGLAGHWVSQAVELLGIPLAETFGVEVHYQRYAKIAPISEEERRAFMFWATDTFNIYSLGRFATWRPGLLLDDLVHDCKKIKGWIESPSRYAVQQSR
jgi:hypothetical protein